jgi:LysR family transcriptional regulator, hydrogen peroxide-inducible genes activator
MTLQELRYVVALVDTGHFSQAAELCFVSQSTLSCGLKKLEDALGVTLFDRGLKHVTPTAVGQEIAESARLLLKEADHVLELAKFAQDPMARKVYLGVIPTLGPYYLPHALTLMHAIFPKLRLLLREEMTPRILARLADGSMDAGLLALPVKDPNLDVTPLFVEPFLAALPPDHPLAKKKEVSIDNLAKAGLLLLEEGHCLRDQALEACHLEGLENEEIRATSLETLRQLVALGLGVTLLPVLAGGCTTSISSGKQLVLKPLAAPGASRTICLAWRRRSPIADTMESLAQSLKESLPPGVLAVK